MSANEIPRTILQNEYPDPKTLPAPPQPTQRQPLPLVTLSRAYPRKICAQVNELSKHFVEPVSFIVVDRTGRKYSCSMEEFSNAI